MNKHTPGPWEIHPDQPNIVHAPAAGYFVADVFSGHRASAENAALIASAPDLAEQLELAKDRIAQLEQELATYRGMQPDGWIRLTDSMPPFGEDARVLIYTEGTEFAGEQFFDVKADKLNDAYFEYPEDMPEICQHATHWMPLPFPKA